LEGGFNNLGDSRAKTNPIFTIGSQFNPGEQALGTMYGIGMTGGKDYASFINEAGLGVDPIGGTLAWGLYIAGNGIATTYFDGSTGHGYFKGTLYSENIEVRDTITIGAADEVYLKKEDNTDVDIGTEVVASVVMADYDGAHFKYVIKDSGGTNVRTGILLVVWDGTSEPNVTDVGSVPTGDTSDVSLSAAINGANIELSATAVSNDWNVKVLTTGL
jgi:hypothetical protein